MTNLYDTITAKKKERVELVRRAKMFRDDAKRGDTTAKAEYDKIAERYEQLNEEMRDIEKEYAIDIQEMGEIISKNLGQTYVPKIFMQTVEENGRQRYNDVFIACYINKNAPYFKNPNHEIRLTEQEYRNLNQSLNETNHITFSHSGALGNYKPLVPVWAFKETNFITLHTYGEVALGGITTKFIKTVEPMLKAELQSTNVINNDEKFNQGI